MGKSTLVNRIVGQAGRHRRGRARRHPRPQGARGRLAGRARSRVIDTGGWLPGGIDLDAKVSRQVERPCAAPTWCCSSSTPRSGVTDDDAAVAEWLRRRRPSRCVLVANKADNDRREAEMWEFLALGLGEPYPVSALHGRRTGDLLDEVVARLPDDKRRAASTADDAAEPRWRAGPARRPRRRAWWAAQRRQVARCSTASSARSASVVHDMPGTTRDAIDTDRRDRPRARSASSTPPACAARARSTTAPSTTRWCGRCRPVDDADVALLVIDATEGVTSQDQRLAERIDAAGCPVVVLLNKWDLLDDAEARADVTAELARMLHFIGDAPVLKVSRAHRQGRPQAAAGAGRRHRALPPPDADARGERRDRRRPAGPAGARRRARPVRPPGRRRPADVHAVRQPGAAADVPALPRAASCGSASTSVAVPIKLRVRRRSG